ncbi:hypothetical protein TNIN_124701 [Trichonephila inaurata madagascariensis]|uniref:Uncharacterized protein n=1 Tax=Trichonephila inaurata madagascariensis TaxID=2747483 RepID=A0A8X6WS77_9ARAC|nr:hypothetical protein TNIN_124701 [Trichonephila inaurata madagascariensis]
MRVGPGVGGRCIEGRPFARPTRGRADGDGQTPGVGSESGATRPRLFLFRTGKVISNKLAALDNCPAFGSSMVRNNVALATSLGVTPSVGNGRRTPERFALYSKRDSPSKISSPPAVVRDTRLDS